LHRGAAAHQSAESCFALRLLNHAPPFEFEGAFFNGAVQDDFELIEIQRTQEEFVGAGLAGFQGKGAVIRSCERHQHHVVAKFANFAKHVQSVARAVSNAIQIEQNGVKIRLIQDALDFPFVGCQRGAQLAAQVPANFRKQLVVIRNDREQVSLRVYGSFRQGAGLRC
jgi:hypothetical protein